MNLYLQVKRKYFKEIAIGAKRFEYRLAKEYWRKRLSKCDSTSMIYILDGGTIPTRKEIESGCGDRVLVFPYRGFKEEILLHPEFGSNPVSVFSIPLIPMGE